MKIETKQPWVRKYQFPIVVIVVVIMWTLTLFWLFQYGEELVQNPCSICAKEMGEDVMCSTQTAVLVTKTFHINGTTSLRGVDDG